MYRIISLGITGFDVPLSLNALPEAKTQLQAMRNIVAFYKTDIEVDSPALYTGNIQAFDAAIAYILLLADFNSFDRLTFIRSYVNPLSAKPKVCAVALG